MGRSGFPIIRGRRVLAVDTGRDDSSHSSCLPRGSSLADMVLPELSDDIILQNTGILEELPDGVRFDGYQQKLRGILRDLSNFRRAGKLRTLRRVVGDMIRLCFFRSLTNVQPKVRNREGTVIRDWVASNRAPAGFWSIIRDKYPRNPGGLGNVRITTSFPGRRFSSSCLLYDQRRWTFCAPGVSRS
jgi:hypothetical protein